MNAVGRERPSSIKGHRSARTGAIPVLITIVALIASCGGPAPKKSLPASTPLPSTQPSPAASTAPTSTPQPWTTLAVAPIATVAQLEPTRSGPGGVALDTTFRLTSLDGRAPADLAARLVANPPLALGVESVSGQTAILRPAAPLRASTTYRLSLARPDGSTEASWAAQTAGPLHVVETIPGDRATQVPVNTGIEITFDQTGVADADLARFLTIAPAVPGQFKVAGRTIAFVPDKPLAIGALYTVTVRHGLPLTGTGQVLGADTVVRFETAATASSDVSVFFRKILVDASTRENAAIGLAVSGPGYQPDGPKVPDTVPIRVHRLAGLEAAMAAYAALEQAPDWTRHVSVRAVNTAGLPLVLSGDVRVNVVPSYGLEWIQIPRPLDAGWYVVTQSWGGVDRQLLLQVTDLATFALVAIDRSAVWVNDLRTGEPAIGATVTIGDQTLGSTDSQGLLVATTPRTLATGDGQSVERNVVVRLGTQSAFRPISLDRVCSACAAGQVDTDGWWHVFATDRVAYRSSDTVNAWGVARNRSTGVVPPSVSIVLLPDGADPAATAPIASATAKPDASGAYAVHLAYTNLPAGWYRVRVTSGATLLADHSVSVGPIVKPAYALSVSTARPAVLEGTALDTTVKAGFFEGTPVVGTELTLGVVDGANVRVRTDALGVASAPVPVTMGMNDTSQWTVVAINGNPTLPEEAQITGSANVAVFRSSALVDARESSISGTTLTVRGSVNSVDFARFDGVASSDLVGVDPRGPGLANAAVQVDVTEHRAVLTQVGTGYDFVLKRTEPIYESTEKVVALGTRQVRTGADGSYELAIPVQGGDASYEIRATYTDEGHRTTFETWYVSGRWSSDLLHFAGLENADPTNMSNTYSVGDQVRVRFAGGVETPPVARYLWAATRLGMRFAVVAPYATFRTTFDEASVPGFRLTAVRFNGYGYDTAITAFQASLRIDDRRLKVEVTPDQARYAPGATASVAIRTLGPGGSAIPASVYLQAADEKLYATGDASETDPLPALYSAVGDGLVGSATSHQTPLSDWGGGRGDATGGGQTRGDFRDWLISTLVTTGADGRATVAIPLSDDLTSWRVTASAVTTHLEAGNGRAWLNVGLPFFVEATVAPEYLAVDRPSIRVRAFGSGLAAGERVRFTVTSDTLPMAAATVEAAAFQAAEVPLPALSVGTQRLHITAAAGSGSTLRTDSLTRTFSVVATRSTQVRTTWAALDAATGVTSGAGLTTVRLVDAGRGRVVPLLEELAQGDSPRSDRVLAAALAGRVLADQFGIQEPTASSSDDLSRFVNGGGIAIVPYGSWNIDATVLAAMAADPRVSDGDLYELSRVYRDPSETRERKLLAMAGLVALGQAVLADVRAAAAATDLSISERISIALAALNAGDEPLAARLEHDLLAQQGRRLGPWVRIEVGADEESAVQTARLAIVAASLGDPVAADMDAWLQANPPKTTTVDLERALAARGWAMRVPGAEATVAVTVGGQHRVVTVKPGTPATLELTPAQAAEARLEPVSGKVLVVTAWDAPLDGTSLRGGVGLSMTRSVSPAGVIGPADTVIVELSVAIGPAAGGACWRVTDLVPSGLAPISGGGTWNGQPGPIGQSPAVVTGQRVEFCATYDPRNPTLVLRYVARVVTPGTYRWEPAVLQSETIPDQGLVLAPTTVTILGISR